MPKESNIIYGQEITAEEIVMAAKHNNCETIAYTYSEPTIFFEYAYDIARRASKEGIKNIFVTNGYITEEALSEIGPYLDAANIDLKSFDDHFYQKVCGARLNPVLETIKLHKSLGIWIEITTLIIPTLNDSKDGFRKIAEFIKEIDDEIPWHISRFYPTYELIDLPPTPVSTLHQAKKIGLEVGLKYVYEGNVPGGAGENTYCYECGKEMIRRFGYQILENRLKNSSCTYCGAIINGVM
jgi:pyruvate formate lyase activating enzyme